MSVTCPSCGTENKAPTSGTQVVCSVCFHIWDKPPVSEAASAGRHGPGPGPADQAAGSRARGGGPESDANVIGTYRRAPTTHTADRVWGAGGAGPAPPAGSPPRAQGSPAAPSQPRGGERVQVQTGGTQVWAGPSNEEVAPVGAGGAHQSVWGQPVNAPPRPAAPPPADPFGQAADPFASAPSVDPFSGPTGVDPFGASTPSSGAQGGAGPRDPFASSAGQTDPLGATQGQAINTYEGGLGAPPDPFGAAPGGSSFGAPADPFGASAPGADPFGAGAPNDPFAAGGSSESGAADPFGAPGPAADPFGSPAPTPFGQSPAGPSSSSGAFGGSSNPFGTSSAPAPAAPFDASVGSGAFGTPASEDPFSGGPDPFAGSSAPSSFGAPSNPVAGGDPFGQAPDGASIPTAGGRAPGGVASDPFGMPGADPFGAPSAPSGHAAWDDPFGGTQAADENPFGSASFEQGGEPPPIDVEPIMGAQQAQDLGTQSTFKVTTGAAAAAAAAGDGAAPLFDLDDGSDDQAHPQSKPAPGARRRARRRSGKKRANKRKARLVALGAAVLVGGLSLSFTDLGPFGINAIFGEADTGSRISTPRARDQKPPPPKWTSAFAEDSPQALVKKIKALTAKVRKGKAKDRVKAQLVSALLHLKDRHPSIFHATPQNNTTSRKLLSPAVRKLDPQLDVLTKLTQPKKGEAVAAAEALLKGAKPPTADHLYLRGRSLLKQGKRSAAREFYLGALKKAPKMQSALYDLGMIEMKTGRMKEARKTFERLRALNDNHSLAHIQLGSIAAQESRFADARKSVGDALAKAKLEKNPQAQFQAHRLIANLNRQDERHKDYIASLKRALAVLPRDETTAIELASWLTKEGKSPEALKYLERCGAGCRSAKFVNALVGAYLVEKRNETARLILKKGLVDHPKDTGLRMIQAKFEMEQQHVATAKRIYQAITTDDASFAPAYIELAKLQENTSRPGLALATLERGVKTATNKVPVLEKLAKLYIALDQTMKAKAAMTELLKIAPERTDVRLGFARLLTSKLGMYSDALPYYERLDELQALDVDAKVEHADVLYHLGRLTDAAAIVDAVLKESREHIEANIIRGGILTRKKNYLEADQVLRNALKISGASARAYLYLGLNERAEAEADSTTSLDKSTKLRKSADYLLKAVQLDPDNLGIRFNLAEVLTQVGGVDRRAAALREYNYIVKRYAKFTSPLEKKSIRPDVYLNRGRIYIINASYRKAMLDFNQAMLLAPERDDIVIEYADALQRTKNFKESEGLLNEVLKRNPEHPGAHFVLGEIAVKRGKRSEAERHFVRSVNAAHDTYPHAHRILGYLYKDRGMRTYACNHFGHFVRLMPTRDPMRIDVLGIMKRQLRCPPPKN